MSFRVRLLIATLVLLALSAAYAFADPPGFAMDFKYKKADGTVDILKGDKVVARYVYKDTPRPYIYPITSPDGIAVTRNYPMKEVAGEPTDHPHHRSMWVGYGSINGVDFWADGEKSGKIVQKSIDFQPITVNGYWSIHTVNDWVLPDGRQLMQDDRRVAFYSCKYGTLIVTVMNLSAPTTSLDFKDSKEGFFAMRLAPELALKDGKGHIVNSEGDKDDKAWGKRARWIDYTGEIGGKTVGVTIFDSHRNYGYPTYWHARDYGLLAANPFGGMAFTGDAKNDSSHTIDYRKTERFVYVTLIHDGKLDADVINQLADDVTGKPTPQVPEAGIGPLRRPEAASSPEPASTGKQSATKADTVKAPPTPAPAKAPESTSTKTDSSDE